MELVIMAAGMGSRFGGLNKLNQYIRMENSL